MPKNLFQDMVRVKRMEQERAGLRKSEPKPKPEPPRPPKERSERSEKREKKRRPMIWFVAIAAVCIFLFALSFLFARADVTVTPKIKSVTLNENLTAIKDATGNDLPFDVVIISGDEDKTVAAVGQKEVSLKAQGVAVLYNNYSAAAQNLDIDTRLEGSNGKIYKTLTKTTVPGMKDGKPGSVEVKIYGSAPGPEYNSEPLDFKIFGFKGTPKYSKFYGRSKDSITGGQKGMVPDLGGESEASLSQELKDALRVKLLGKATEQIPSGFVLFKDAVFLSIDGENSTPGQEPNTVVAKVTGTLYGILFAEEDLTKKVVKDNIKGYDGSPVFIPNIKNLTFSSPGTSASNLSGLTKLNFSLTGPAQVVSKVDTEKLVSDLVGRPKKSFDDVLSEYSAIDSAESVISPFWRRSFPDKIKKIHITVNYPN